MNRVARALRARKSTVSFSFPPPADASARGRSIHPAGGDSSVQMHPAEEATHGFMGVAAHPRNQRCPGSQQVWCASTITTIGSLPQTWAVGIGVCRPGVSVRMGGGETLRERRQIASVLDDHRVPRSAREVVDILETGLLFAPRPRRNRTSHVLDQLAQADGSARVRADAAPRLGGEEKDGDVFVIWRSTRADVESEEG